jgi:hypothetical protein
VLSPSASGILARHDVGLLGFENVAICYRDTPVRVGRLSRSVRSLNVKPSASGMFLTSRPEDHLDAGAGLQPQRHSVTRIAQAGSVHRRQKTQVSEAPTEPTAVRFIQQLSTLVARQDDGSLATDLR